MRWTAVLLLSPVLALAACSGEEEGNQLANRSAPSAATTSARAAGVTPMAERVAVLGILNKRNGIVRDIALRPGQSARWNDLVVRLRACEATAPWEDERLTGAFVQVEADRADQGRGRIFSGWLYKESPSLNVVEHPVYDVWPKSCEMTFPGAPASAEPAVSATSASSPSRARNSGGGRRSRPESPAPSAEPEPAEPATPSAADSNAT